MVGTGSMPPPSHNVVTGRTSSSGTGCSPGFELSGRRSNLPRVKREEGLICDYQCFMHVPLQVSLVMRLGLCWTHTSRPPADPSPNGSLVRRRRRWSVHPPKTNSLNFAHLLYGELGKRRRLRSRVRGEGPDAPPAPASWRRHAGTRAIARRPGASQQLRALEKQKWHRKNVSGGMVLD